LSLQSTSEQRNASANRHITVRVSWVRFFLRRVPFSATSFFFGLYFSFLCAVCTLEACHAAKNHVGDGKERLLIYFVFCSNWTDVYLMSLLNLPNDIVFVIFDELYSPYPLLADPHCRPVCNRRRVYGDLNFYRAWTGPSVSIRTSISTCRNSLNSILDQVSKEFARLRRARVSAVTLTAPHAPIIPYPASTSIHLDLSTENFTSKVDDEKLIEVVGYLPNDFKPRISGLSVVLRASDSAVLYGLCQRLISNIADNIKSLSIRAPECGKDANESCFDWMVLLAPLGESLEHLELHVACLEASDEVLALFSAQVKKLAPALQANLKSLSLTWPITTNWQLDLSDFVNVEALNINYERESEELPASIEAWVNGAKKKPEILEWTLSKSCVNRLTPLFQATVISRTYSLASACTYITDLLALDLTWIPINIGRAFRS
jgi:hypothetical protein